MQNLSQTPHTIPPEPEPPPEWGMFDDFPGVTYTLPDNNGNAHFEQIPEAAPAPQDEWVDPWKVYTLADAYAPRPPIQYTVDRLIPEASLTMVYGAPGDFKSYLLADMAVCIAADLPWLPEASWQPGAAPFPTRQTPVIWIDFDNGSDLTHARFEALGKARKLPPDIPLFYYSMPSPYLDAGSDESCDQLIERILHHQAGSVFIDNLRTISGGADENSAFMSNIMQGLRRVVETTRAGITLIHHQRKTNGDRSGRAGDAIRGHSSIEAALDLALIIDREEYSDDITIRPTKTRRKPVLPFGATFTHEDDQTGETIEAQFYGRKVEDTFSDGAIERAIKAALFNAKLNQTELLRATKEITPEASKDRTLAIIRRMEAAGKLQSTKGDRNATLYNLAH